MPHAAIRRAVPALLALALAAGCVEKDPEDQLPTISGGGGTTAQLRVMNAIPDVPSVTLQLDDSAAIGTALTFRQATAGYRALSADAHRVRITPTGFTTPAVDITPQLLSGTATTVIATGEYLAGRTQAIVLADTLTAPASGQVRLRFVHASPSGAQVDVFLSAPDAELPTAPTVLGLAYLGASRSVTVPAGTYRVRLTPSGFRTPSVDVTTAPLAAGTVATLVLVDPTRAGEGATLVLLMDRAP